MYPRISVEKRHPDGTPRARWLGYSLGVHEGATRVYLPAASRSAHVLGGWTIPGRDITLYHAQWDFVPHYLRDAADPRFYVDVVRSVEVSEGRVVFVDLFLDLGISTLRGVTEKDEELLDRLTPSEASRARRTRDALRKRIAEADPLFDPDTPWWAIPDDAAALPPLWAEPF